MIRALLVVLLLCVDGWGCAGAAQDGAELCDDELHGWLCDETCGTCTCDGHVTPAADGRGECVL